MTAYKVQARNFSESSENRIHSDEIARKYGFKGALVPGVAVYGHLIHPLVEHFGARWLGESVADLRLLKPAYHGDDLELTLVEDGNLYTVACTNADKELLATVKSQNQVPALENRTLALLDKQYKNPERVEISWDTVVQGQAFVPWELTLTATENARYTSEVADQAELYSEFIHPHYLLSLTNTVLTREYIMPTWIHVGSETRHRSPLYIGDQITIRTVVTERWQKKGHEFIKVHSTYWREKELTTDILHTAIFKVA